MPLNSDGKKPRKSLDDAVREARKQAASGALYIVATKRGYVISEEPSPLLQNYYRVNMDGTTTMMVSDPETGRLMELPGHPASYPSLTTTDLALEEDAT